MKPAGKTTIFLFIILAALCLAAIVVESQAKIFHRLYDNYILDNRNHYLSCSALPSESEVFAVIDQHQELIQAIEAVHPGQVGMEIDTFTCPGKADILFWYASHQDRLDIEALIGATTFFGIPYRLQNR